jgi:nitroreductase
VRQRGGVRGRDPIAGWGKVIDVEFADVVRRRRMVRDYDPDRPVPPEVRERLLEHAIRAPSAGFSQGWAFLVLESPQERERFWAVTTDGGAPDRWLTRMRRAPLLIVPLSHKAAYLDRYAEPDKGWSDRDERRWPVPYWDIDTGMAALLMLLTAVDEGLGACFFGIPPAGLGHFRKAFGIPEEYRPIGCISVGYEGKDDRRSPSLRRGRRKVTEVAHRGHWGVTEP